jgi:hypothetical protein
MGKGEEVRREDGYNIGVGFIMPPSVPGSHSTFVNVHKMRSRYFGQETPSRLHLAALAALAALGASGQRASLLNLTYLIRRYQDAIRL